MAFYSAFLFCAIFLANNHVSNSIFQNIKYKKIQNSSRHHELKKDIQDTNHPICACDTKIDKTPQFFCVFTTSKVSDTGF